MRLREPVPIVLGFFVATFAIHAFDSAVGNWCNLLVDVIDADALRWILALASTA